MSAPLWILCIYAIVSLLTFFTFGYDKHQAKLGKRRIPERTLHLLELLGGWPGSALGQAFFRHKRRKFSYMIVFAGIVLLHLAGWVEFFCYRWR